MTAEEIQDFKPLDHPSNEGKKAVERNECGIPSSDF